MIIDTDKLREHFQRKREQCRKDDKKCSEYCSFSSVCWRWCLDLCTDGIEFLEEAYKKEFEE